MLRATEDEIMGILNGTSIECKMPPVPFKDAKALRGMTNIEEQQIMALLQAGALKRTNHPLSKFSEEELNRIMTTGNMPIAA